MKRAVVVWGVWSRKVDTGMDRLAALKTMTHPQAPVGTWRVILEPLCASVWNHFKHDFLALVSRSSPRCQELLNTP